jgi:hypothetical protein
LFPVFGSSTPETTLAVSLIVVPFAVPATTVTTTVIVAFDPEASAVGEEQVMEFGVVVVMKVQVHPAAPLAETKVVFAGRFSVTVVLGEAAGPLLVTTCV